VPRLPAALLAAMLLVTVPASAAEHGAYRFELTPFAAWRLGGGFSSGEEEGSKTRLDLDDDAAFGLVLNIPSDEPTEWEFVLSHQPTAIERRSATDARAIDLNISYAHLGGRYLFDGNQVRPYIAATLGLTHLDPRDREFRSETKFSFAIGGGYQFFPAARFGLRLDARAFGTVLDSSGSLFCRAGPEAADCRIAARGRMLWQWEIGAGASLRF